MATADFPREAVVAPAGVSAQSGASLQAQLKRLAARRNAQRLWNCIVRALCPGVALAALVMLLHRFYILDAPFWLPIALIGAAALFGVFDGLRNRAGTFDAALDADRVLGLRERLSSALLFVAPGTKAPRNYAPENTPLVPALVDDAAQRASSLDPRRVYPMQMGKAARVLAVATIALATFVIMPNIDRFRSQGARALAAQQKRDGKELEAVAKQVRERKDIPKDDEAKRAAQKLEALGRKMQRGRMGKKETLLALGEMRQEVERVREKGNSGTSNLEQVEEQLKQEEMQSEEGRKMQRELENKDLKKAADQLDKLADKMEKGEMTPQEKEQAANDLEKTAKALRENGNEDAAKQLEDAAKQLRKESQQGQSGGGQKQQKGQQKQQNGQQKSGQQQGGQQNQGQKGNQQQQQGGSQQGSQGGQQQGGKNGQQGSSGGSNALRNLAKGMRNGAAGNSGAMRDMLNKIRNAEKNTGQGNQPGNGGQGEGGKGNGNGKGGSNLTPNDPTGVVGGGAGLGPRNNAQGVGKGGGVSKIRGKTGSKDKRRWADEWSSSLPKTQKKISRITGKMGDSGEVEQLPTRSEAKGGQVNTPTYEVPENYRRDAADAITQDAVPPAYKQPVKDYFDSLKPAGN